MWYISTYISGPSSGEMIYSRHNGETAETCVEHVKRFIVKNYLKLKIHGKNVKLTNFYYILVRIASGCHLNKNYSNKFSKIYYLHDNQKKPSSQKVTYANQTKINLSNMYLSKMPLEIVTFDIYMYLPCTDLNLKTTLKNIF